jgi:hypothetical protein
MRNQRERRAKIMLTILIDKVYHEGRLCEFKVKPDKDYLIGSGRVWVVEFDNGRELDLRMSAYGKEGYRKKDFKVVYKD